MYRICINMNTLLAENARSAPTTCLDLVEHLQNIIPFNICVHMHMFKNKSTHRHDCEECKGNNNHSFVHKDNFSTGLKYN